MYIMYSMMEGCRSEDILENKWRFIYRTLSLSSLFYFGIISIPGYIFTVDNVDLSSLMYLLTVYAASIYTLGFIPFITHYSRQGLRAIIESLDNDFNFTQTSKQTLDGR